jgi:CheY-like chemotaxis protein
LRGGKILLAEDNDINVLVIGEYLNQWNALFDVAENGEEAVKMVSENLYELVLMDLQMPVMDGYEATKKIREMSDPTKANIHIYAMTADAMMEIKERVMEAGMNGIFHKPFDPESVYRTLYRDMIGEKS